MVVTAGDCRLGKMGSAQELMFGDGAASVMVGTDDVIAEYKGSFSTGHDFVDHMRGADTRYDRQWEERWMRDIGVGRFIPEAINGLCAKLGMAPGDFDKIIYPTYFGGRAGPSTSSSASSRRKCRTTCRPWSATPGRPSPC